MERARLSGTVVKAQAWFVDWLILRDLRRHFRAVYVRGALPETTAPIVLFANHHYWWDGYLGYWLIRSWGRRMVVWMESYRRFPPFAAVGALPFPPNDPIVRARTIKRTVQILSREPAVLLLFPEGELYGDTDRLLPFQRSLHWLHCRLPQAMLLPLAIHIELSYHQYPRAYLSVGEPFESKAIDSGQWLQDAARTVEQLLHQTRADARAIVDDAAHSSRGFRVLLRGKLSIHERF